jgi:hypothetical protein
MDKTWNDLLFPDVQSTSHIPLLYLSKRELAHSSESCSAQTSSFSPLEWDPDRLPSCVHLARNLPLDMYQDLRRIVTKHYPNQAAGSQCREFGDDLTADICFKYFRRDCRGNSLDINHKAAVADFSTSLHRLVRTIFGALTGDMMVFLHKVAMDRRAVITDHAYILGGRIAVICEDKSPTVFDHFLGQLMELLEGSHSQAAGLDLFPETLSTTYEGYRAILGKVCISASV